MLHIPTTATAAGKIKTRARALRSFHSSLGAARDAAAQEDGYESYHHVTECLRRSNASVPAISQGADGQHLVAEIHSEELSPASRLSTYLENPKNPRSRPVWDLLQHRDRPLVPVERMEIKARAQARTLCRLKIGTRVWDLHLDHLGKLRIGLDALKRGSYDPELSSHSAPFADVVSIRYLDGNSDLGMPRYAPGFAVAKYESEHIFSLNSLSVSEVAEVAFQFGLLIDPVISRYHVAVKAMTLSPAFAILAENLKQRRLKPLEHPDYWDWREAAASL